MHELLAPLVFVLHSDHQTFQHASEAGTPRLVPPTASYHSRSFKLQHSLVFFLRDLPVQVVQFFNELLINVFYSEEMKVLLNPKFHEHDA